MLAPALLLGACAGTRDLPVASSTTTAAPRAVSASRTTRASFQTRAITPPTKTFRSTGDVLNDLQEMCWSLRIQCDGASRGQGLWEVTANFDSPKRVLSSDSVTAEGPSIGAALRKARDQVRRRLGLQSDGGDQIARENTDLLERLARESAWFRLDCIHKNDGRLSYDVLARTTLANRDRGKRSAIVRGDTLPSTVTKALKSIGA